VILCVNKWDTIDKGKKRGFEQQVRDQLKFMDYAPWCSLGEDGRGG